MGLLFGYNMRQSTLSCCDNSTTYHYLNEAIFQQAIIRHTPNLETWDILNISCHAWSWWTSKACHGRLLVTYLMKYFRTLLEVSFSHTSELCSESQHEYPNYNWGNVDDPGMDKCCPEYNKRFALGSDWQWIQSCVIAWPTHRFLPNKFEPTQDGPWPLEVVALAHPHGAASSPF